MCGNDPRLCNARPWASRAAVISPYRNPADTVTPRSPTSITFGSSATLTSVPVLSAIRLNECPVPSTRTFSLAATSSCSSATDRGASSALANLTLPAQFVTFVMVCTFLARRSRNDSRTSSMVGD